MSLLRRQFLIDHEAKAIPMNTTYQDLLAQKRAIVAPVGFNVSRELIHSILFEFQRDIVLWAIRKGRCAIFADTGLGKTFMLLEWARLVAKEVHKPVLIIAPLSVARQTVREAHKIDSEVVYIRSMEAVTLDKNLYITNYEMIEHMDASVFGAVVLDESSILKNLDGKLRHLLTEMFKGTPYRLCCTATPAPNDITEIGRHAEFLGIMSNAEMLAAFFINDMKQKDGVYRLKRHAVKPFYRWLSSWGMAVKKPSDLGYSDDGYILPGIDVKVITTNSDYTPEGMMPGFFVGSISAADAHKVRRATIEDRISQIVEIVNGRRGEEAAPTGISAGVVQDSQGTDSSIPRTDEGNPQPEAPRDLSHQSRAARIAESGIPRLGKKPSRTKEGRESEISRDHSGTIQSDDGNAGVSVRDLRVLRSDGQEFLSTDRPLPYDGESTRPALHELQSGIGEIQGQHRSPGDGDSLPENEQWVIWCGLNTEQDALAAAFGDDCISVSGNQSPDEKADRLERWLAGEFRILLSKVSIAGFGINMQNCHHMLFCGIDYSWESYYQAVRRCYRFGQSKVVEVVVVTSEQERPIFDVVMNKEIEAIKMTDELIKNAAIYEKEELSGIYSQDWTYTTDDIQTDKWHLMLGDSVERINEIPENSVDLSVYSPPFIALYTYTPTERDMGNSKNSDQFFAQYQYIIDGILRITKPGRNTCVHVQQVAASKVNDGYIGIKDFRGDVIRAYIARGWTFYGEVTIDKNPQVQAIRTKAKGLMFQQLHKDSVANRPAFGDYILIFQKPGENKVPVIPDVTNEEWIEWAHPIWYGIRESDTLNVAVARSDEDERHMCPLQLPVIERCVRLYSNPGETVFSPFAGIGSEGFESLRRGRKFIGIELKREYFNVAAKYLAQAEENASMPDLFSYADQLESVTE